MLCGNFLIAFQTVEKVQQKLSFLLYMYQSGDGSMIGLPIVCFHTSDIAWFNSNDSSLPYNYSAIFLATYTPLAEAWERE